MKKITYFLSLITLVAITTTLHAQLDIDITNKDVLAAQKQLIFAYESGNQTKIQEAQNTLKKTHEKYEASIAKFKTNSGVEKLIIQQMVDQAQGSVNVAKAAVKMAVQSKNFISIIATEGQLQAAKNALTAAELAQAIQSIK
jgi:predicted Fe-Mo cluster-binding NifX family protein